jgi:hypothetical protein
MTARIGHDQHERFRKPLGDRSPEVAIEPNRVRKNRRWLAPAANNPERQFAAVVGREQIFPSDGAASGVIKQVFLSFHAAMIAMGKRYIVDY